MDSLVHAGNVLFLISYTVRDILWLRAITVLGCASLIPYYYLRPEPLLAPIAWNLLFILVNAHRIWLLLLERRPVELNEDEAALHAAVFPSLRPREFLALLAKGEWKDAGPGETLVEESRALERFLVLHRGKAEVRRGGRPVGVLGAGQFVGEMSFLTGRETSASVVAAEPTRYFAWPLEDLKTYLRRKPDLQATIHTLLGGDLAAKLRASAN